MALARHTSPGREVGGRGRRKARPLPSLARARGGHGTSRGAAVSAAHGPQHRGETGAPCCYFATLLLGCILPFIELFHTILPHVFSISFPRQDSGCPEHAEVSWPIRRRERRPHRPGSPLRAAEQPRVNYEQARSRAGAGRTGDPGVPARKRGGCGSPSAGLLWGPRSLAAACPGGPSLRS